MAEAAALMVFLWSSVVSWLTPTVLFLFLNLVIAGIFALSSFSSYGNSTAKKIARSPSLVLDRLKSFNLHSYNVQTQSPFINADHPQQQQQQQQQPHLEGEEKEAAEEEEVQEEHHIIRCQSDTKPDAWEFPEKLPKKMKKSATMKSPFNHFEFHEEEDKVETVKRPATTTTRVREREADAEVDAKADDFINRFKHQLKLQRLDSIIRYKEMLNRGTDN